MSELYERKSYIGYTKYCTEFIVEFFTLLNEKLGAELSEVEEKLNVENLLGVFDKVSRPDLTFTRFYLKRQIKENNKAIQYIQELEMPETDNIEEWEAYGQKINKIYET